MSLGLTAPLSALPTLKPKQRTETLQALKKAYQRVAATEEQKGLTEIFYLVAIAMTPFLLKWSRQYQQIALPSAILERLESGLKKNKRYLGRWVTKRLGERLRRYALTQAAMAIAAEESETVAYQPLPDPGRQKIIQRALLNLTPKDREIIVWLSQDKEAQEIAQLRQVSEVAAWQQISRARKAFRKALPEDFLK